MIDYLGIKILIKYIYLFLGEDKNSESEFQNLFCKEPSQYILFLYISKG